MNARGGVHLDDNSIEKENRKMNKLFWSLGMTAVTALAIAVLCAANKVTLASSGAESKPAGIEVNIDNFSFSSMSLTVSAGTTVTWINKDDVPHTVVSTEKVFASPVLDTDEKFSYTFAKPGTYPYYCSIHPKMTAKVVVQ
jgi:plastocyanin